MPKSYPNLRLASTVTQWKEVDQIVIDAIDRITGHGEQDKAEALFGLLDLLTNDYYNSSDREILSHVALRHAFSYTEACEKALKAETERLNPVAVRKVSNG